VCGFATRDGCGRQPPEKEKPNDAVLFDLLTDWTAGRAPPVFVERVYDFLSCGEPPRKADCIFVLAGKEERKTYGIGLWNTLWAPELILSVGRFEWRRFSALGLPGDGGLRRLVDETPPAARHFFVSFGAEGARAVLIEKGVYGTLSEARALAAVLESRPVRSVMVVSTAIHLRRVALAFRRQCRASGLQLSFIPVPEELSSIRREALAQSPEARREVWREFLILLGYCVAFP